MCWRGHSEHFHVQTTTKDGYSWHRCKLCHAHHVSALRGKRDPVYEPLFEMNRGFYNCQLKRHGWTDTTVAVIGEISRYTLRDYKRGRNGGITRHKARRVIAAKIAQALRVPFSQLWSEV